MKLLLILGSIVWVLNAFPGGMMASGMMDGPAAAPGVASYPLAAAAAPVLSWPAHR